MHSISLAFDSGGTNTRCMAFDERGNIVGVGRAGSANPNVREVLECSHNLLGAAEKALAGYESVQGYSDAPIKQVLVALSAQLLGAPPNGTQAARSPSQIYRQLVSAVYAMPPVSLAPLALQVVKAGERGDVVARELLEAAVTELVHTCAAVLGPASAYQSPQMVLAGSIMQASHPVGRGVRARLREMFPSVAMYDGVAPVLGTARLMLAKAGQADAYAQLRTQFNVLETHGALR